jgi:hypothetical protein
MAVDVSWFTAYVEPFQRWLGTAVFGGRIRARYEAPVPNWIIRSETVLVGPYAFRDFGDHVQPLSSDYEDHFPVRSKLGHSRQKTTSFPLRSPARRRAEQDRTRGETDVIGRILSSEATGYGYCRRWQNTLLGVTGKRLDMLQLTAKVIVKPRLFGISPGPP